MATHGRSQRASVAEALAMFFAHGKSPTYGIIRCGQPKKNSPGVESFERCGRPAIPGAPQGEVGCLMPPYPKMAAWRSRAQETALGSERECPSRFRWGLRYPRIRPLMALPAGSAIGWLSDTGASASADSSKRRTDSPLPRPGCILSWALASASNVRC